MGGFGGDDWFEDDFQIGGSSGIAENLGGINVNKISNNISLTSDFNELREQISKLIFGDQPDKILSIINKFLRNTEIFKDVLAFYNFPTLIIHCLFWPLHLFI